MSHDLTLNREQRGKFRRILASALVGNMLEFYDLFIYGFLAAILAKAFFPTGDPYTSMLATAATFGISYFIRPLGAGEIRVTVSSETCDPVSIIVRAEPPIA